MPWSGTSSNLRLSIPQMLWPWVLLGMSQSTPESVSIPSIRGRSGSNMPKLLDLESSLTKLWRRDLNTIRFVEQGKWLWNWIEVASFSCLAKWLRINHWKSLDHGKWMIMYHQMQKMELFQGTLLEMWNFLNLVCYLEALYTYNVSTIPDLPESNLDTTLTIL